MNSTINDGTIHLFIFDGNRSHLITFCGTFMNASNFWNSTALNCGRNLQKSRYRIQFPLFSVNLDNHVGSCGFFPIYPLITGLYPIRLLKVDDETGELIRDPVFPLQLNRNNREIFRRRACVSRAGQEKSERWSAWSRTKISFWNSKATWTAATHRRRSTGTCSRRGTRSSPAGIFSTGTTSDISTSRTGGETPSGTVLLGNRPK